MKIKFCPCCGRPSSNVRIEALLELDLLPQERRLVEVFVTAAPYGLVVDDVIDELDRLRLRPFPRPKNDPTRPFRVLVHRTNKKIEPCGWTLGPAFEGRLMGRTNFKMVYRLKPMRT